MKVARASDPVISEAQISPEFDSAFYRQAYADLSTLGDAQLLNHFERHGQSEGRSASFHSKREGFLELVRSRRSVLEIGPFCNPAVRGPNVRYFDVLDTAALIERAKVIGYPADRTPDISYVSGTGDLSVVTDRFDSVMSSHCIEHQPDLVHHFNQVSEILLDEAYYFLIVPNKLYCFDHFIPESTIANIVAAHIGHHKCHTLESVIGHRALTTHNDHRRHWRGDHSDLGYTESIGRRVKLALVEFTANPGKYVDVHAWQFTPPTFRLVTQQLYDLGFSSLRPIRVYSTPKDRNEFCAILQKK
jgi:hypothetical protein